MSLRRVMDAIGGSLVKGAPVTLVESKPAEETSPVAASGDQLYAEFWEHLHTVKPKDWELESFYTRSRGGPVTASPSVAIVVPGYRELDAEARPGRAARAAVREDMARHGIESRVANIEGDSLVCRMRQRACHLFLCSPATHMLFLDADIEARDPDCIRQMLATGHDVIAGACPFKDRSGRTVHNRFPEDDGKPVEFDEHGCVEVQDAGTGCMLISRRALITMQKAHPELLHMSMSHANDRGAPLWALFDTRVVDGIYCSEDYFFCHLWQQLGGSVYVYPKARFRHWGIYGYDATFEGQYGIT